MQGHRDLGVALIICNIFQCKNIWLWKDNKVSHGKKLKSQAVEGRSQDENWSLEKEPSQAPVTAPISPSLPLITSLVWTLSSQFSVSPSVFRSLCPLSVLFHLSCLLSECRCCTLLLQTGNLCSQRHSCWQYLLLLHGHRGKDILSRERPWLTRFESVAQTVESCKKMTDAIRTLCHFNEQRR